MEAKLQLIPGICSNGEQTEFVPIIFEKFILEIRLNLDGSPLRTALLYSWQSPQAARLQLRGELRGRG